MKPQQTQQICPSNPYSGQFHCEHEVGQVQVHYTKPKTFICCWCGNERIEVPVPITSSSYTNEIKHGGFVTPPISLF